MVDISVVLKVGTGDILSNDNTVIEAAFVLTEPYARVDVRLRETTQLSQPVQRTD